jgi:multiple sugar transport system substrate-binding protein
MLGGCGIGMPSAATPTRAPRPGAPTPAARAEPTTLVWSYWGDPKEVEINERIAAAFEARHPEIAIAIQHEPWPTYFTRLTAGWEQKQAPDVMFLNNIPIYARTGALENLDPYIARDRFDIDDFYPTLMETFRYQGNVYGLPRDNDTKVLFYNKQLFKQAGLTPPSGDWTWQEFRETARKLTRRGPDGQASSYGFAYETSDWWRLWIWQNNGDILDDHFNPTRVRLAEPAAIEALQFLADLTNVDRVTPPGDQLTGAMQRQLFRAGKVAMVIENHSFVPSVVEEPGLEWDVAPLPRGQRRANLAGGAGYVMSAWSTKKDAAWTFIKFLEGREGQALFAEAGVAVPARKSIREENIFSRRRPYAIQVFFDETALGVHNYYFPRANEMNTRLNAELMPIFQGKESAASAVRRIAPWLEQLVASAPRP